MAAREVNDITAALIRDLSSSHLEFKVAASDINGIGFDLTGFTTIADKDGSNVGGVVWHCVIPLNVKDTPILDSGSYWHDQFGEYRFNLLFMKSATTGNSVTLAKPHIGPYTFPDSHNVAVPCFIDYDKPRPALGVDSGEEQYILRSADGPEVYGIAETKIHVEDDGHCKYVTQFSVNPPDYFADKNKRQRETRSEHEDPRWGRF